MSFIAGPYTITLGALSLGITENGIELENIGYGDPVRGDNLGESIQDNVYRGMDVYLNFIMQEWNAAGASLAYWPYATLGQSGQVGRMDSDIASALVATVVAGTRAVANPNSLTFTKSILAKNFPVKQLFASRLRNVAIRQQVLPATVGQSGNHTWFTLQ